jgi:iron complex outermembrane receptor protein
LDLGRRFGEDKQFGVRLNLAQREGETGVEREHSRFSLATVGLDYRGDQLRLAADFGYQKQRVNEGRSVVHLTTSSLNGKTPSVPDSQHNYAQPWSWSQLEDTYGMFSAEYDLSPDWTAYLIGGSKYTRENGVYASNYVYGANGEARISRLYSPLDLQSSSITSGLRGQLRTGPVSHQVSLAASGIWQEKRNAFETTAAGSRGFGNLYEAVPITEPSATSVSGDLHDPDTTAKVQNKSLALSDTLGFFDERGLLTLGLRRQSISADAWSAANSNRTSNYGESITTPAYGLVLKPTEYLSLYANRVEALQQGPTAPGAAINNGVMFAPYRSKQVEVGAKFDWGRFGGNLSLFRIEQPQGVLGGDGYYRVDAEQRNRGVELSLFGEPLDGLRLLGGATWTEAELRGTAGGSNDGNQAVGVPQFQFNLGADWDVPGVPGLSLNGLLLRTGGQFVDSANEYSIPAWTRIDLGARYQIQLDERAVTFNALRENVADNNYWASANGGYLTQGAPRTFKLAATVDF